MSATDMDISVRHIVITEDEDLNLDKLLIGDTSGAVNNEALQHPPSPRGPSPPPATITAPPFSQTGKDATAALVSSSATVPEVAPPSPIILASEEDGEASAGNWYLPPPAQPGDFLSGSLHKVPSKSILKKTSSYGNFDTSASSIMKKTTSSVSLAGSIQARLDSSAHRVSRKAKQSSFMSHGGGGENSSQASSSVGWNLDDSGRSQLSSPGAGRPFGMAMVVPSSDALPPVPGLKTGDEGKEDERMESDADRAGGLLDSSGSTRQSASSAPTKMRRSVSFHSVGVREYDRTIGDNPSCRSGPPLSLDWSYSKKYEKHLDEYEAERSIERVRHLRKLHVNKYKRRNMLAFHWGHTEEEMKEARKHTKKTQRQRSVTRTLLPLQKAEEVFISVRNLVSGKRNKDVHGDIDECWSDMSNSASTQGSSLRTGGSGVSGENHPAYASFRERHQCMDEGLNSSVRTA